MQESQFLGLDVGTQSTKGVVVDEAAGNIIARASVPYDLIEGLPEGAAEQDPETWYAAVLQVTKELLTQPGVDASLIKALAVSGQQHGCVALDKDLKPIRPAKLWCDTSTATEAAELSAEFGRPIPTGFTASKIRWMAHHEPENFRRIACIVLPHDYVNLRLSGRLFTEAGDASGTGYFDSQRRDYRHHEVRELMPGVSNPVPPLLAHGQVGGTVTDSKLGLPASTIVAVGSGDNMMSAIGSGATRAGVGVLSLGTSATLFVQSDKYINDPDGLIAPFCDATGKWLPLMCQMNMTNVTEEVRKAFCDTTDDDALLHLAQEAEQVPPGCHGLHFIPYLQGERVPDLPNATGCLLGIRPGLMRAGIVYRAALEGTSLNLAWGFERFSSHAMPLNSLRVVGGGSKSALWTRIIADTLQIPLQRLKEADSAALGAAIQAAWTWQKSLGGTSTIDELASEYVHVEGELIEPVPENRSYSQERLSAFKKTVMKLFPNRVR